MWHNLGPLPEGLHLPETYLPDIQECANTFATALRSLFEAYPEIQLWWRNLDQGELFSALDAEVWPQRPMTQNAQPYLDDVRVSHWACFEVAWRVVEDLSGPNRSPELLNAILTCDEFKDWPRYLCPMINILAEGRPSSTMRLITGLEGEEHCDRKLSGETTPPAKTFHQRFRLPLP